MLTSWPRGPSRVQLSSRGLMPFAKSHHGVSRDDGDHWRPAAVAPTLTVNDQPPAHATMLVSSADAVRRFTPLECERLMGWPDHHTRWGTVDGQQVDIADSQRYQMCGNGVVAPVARWTALRITGAGTW